MIDFPKTFLLLFEPKDSSRTDLCRISRQLFSIANLKKTAFVLDWTDELKKGRHWYIIGVSWGSWYGGVRGRRWVREPHMPTLAVETRRTVEPSVLAVFLEFFRSVQVGFRQQHKPLWSWDPLGTERSAAHTHSGHCVSVRELRVRESEWESNTVYGIRKQH